jgi:putative intracellular protease/amidase
MKRLFCLFILSIILISWNTSAPKVLLFIRDGSSDLKYMLAKEVGPMIEILKRAGFEVTIATISGEVIKTDSITIKSNIKLDEVNIDEYSGIILPCMAAGDSINPKAVTFVKQVLIKGKPLAVQTNAILILAKAGGLTNKKYAFYSEKIQEAPMFPEFKSGIYSGTGVVQDGLLLTSGICPFMARASGFKSQDGTAELTRAFINVIKTKAN